MPEVVTKHPKVVKQVLESGTHEIARLTQISPGELCAAAVGWLLVAAFGAALLADRLRRSRKPRPFTTEQIMEGGPRRDISTPGEGVLTSKLSDRDAATG